MSSCDYAHSDGAYVLGALSPHERQDFERHLAGCADCARSVRELAGLPGLLARVDPALLEPREAAAPVPETLLPRLVAEVRRDRRRRTRRAALLSAAAAAAVVALASWGVTQLAGPGDREADQAAGQQAPPTDSEEGPEGRAMAPLRATPVRASVALESVDWGTKVLLTCSYPEWDDSWRPRSLEYALVVRTDDGRTQQIATWTALVGRTMQLTAATAARDEEIAWVEMRAVDGTPVLRLRS